MQRASTIFRRAISSSFNRSAGHEGGASEHAAAVKTWRNITYAGFIPVTILMLSVFVFSPPHEHHEKLPYPYIQVRNKAFPWGEKDLFEKEEH